MKQYELLAPAGDPSCMAAAFNAGADAVYLAGKSFGARAFAGNFETQELVEALDYAHLLSKKIYLTLNTLIKEKEFGNIAEFLTPFYEHGLDGVIIQGLGLAPFLKKEFPDLELHASTQMTVCNHRFAAWLKEQGFTRVVPARELSLKELQEIRDKAGIEVEAFIHGAMCYCYSGQCLFSSFLGGRSGNRGRCAQPCRLPYRVMEDGKCISEKGDVYPLSLKDLCSLPYIYELMDAGIDSFKIEGRMKSPEYVAGVTEIYRKYMDLYAQGKRPRIEKEDLDQLAHLYIRSDMKDGYFNKHNGRDMISLYSPSYRGCDEELTAQIHDRYCSTKTVREISGRLLLQADTPAKLTLSDGTQTLTLEGAVVQKAQKRPLTQEEARRQISKTGTSLFAFDTLEIEVQDDIFIPVKQLNELRREALSQFQAQLLAPCMRRKAEHTDEWSGMLLQKETARNSSQTAKLYVQIRTKEQAEAVFASGVCPDRIYADYDLFYQDRITPEKIREEAKDTEIFAVLPRIIRKRDDAYLDRFQKQMAFFDGVLVKNLESLAFLERIGYTKMIVTDHFIYNWNRSALDYLNNHRKGYTYPLELSLHENMDLTDRDGEYVVYGRTPMMVTANCIRQTYGRCGSGGETLYLQDRYKKQLPVQTNCIHCYNEIYNPVVMSLHRELDTLIRCGFFTFRLDFTTENKRETAEVMACFSSKIHGKDKEFPFAEYTLGHYKEGAV